MPWLWAPLLSLLQIKSFDVQTLQGLQETSQNSLWVLLSSPVPILLCGLQVVYGCVTDCQNGVYHADLRIGLPAQAATSKCSTLDMDCRPSDCINACLRAGAPIYVHRRIAKERAVYTPPTPSNVQKGIRESCLAEELQHQDPTFFMRMQLQLYISMDQFEVAER